MENRGLVYVGKIIDHEPIPDADFIMSATVVCGEGGKWRGVVRVKDFTIGHPCIVYLPDALIPECPEMEFMKSSNWRVKMRRFKGAPSEVVITPIPISMPYEWKLGDDITIWCGVTKYHKPVPANLQGVAKGNFPDFIPKTDEPNYQRVPEAIIALIGTPYYITEKCDGSSTTAYRYKGTFGVCSRNFELERNEDNGYWKVAIKYGLEEKLPEGYAIQWETCGPKIQGNPMGLKEIDGFAFSGYKIDEQRYLEDREFTDLIEEIGIPSVTILEAGRWFSDSGIDKLGEGVYENGKQREGVVVRSIYNVGHKPISFKVINLNYEK